MQKALTLFPITGMASALVCASAGAAHAVGDYPVFTQHPIVVTSTPPSAPLIFVTDPKLPRQPLPASDATDYLKTIPGFSAVGNGGTNSDPVLRGQFGSRLNILTNGTSLHGACGGRMDPPTSYISPANFDKLIVIKGPQTVLWGPGASAGTVRFDRDTPHFTEPGFRFDGNVVGGSYGRNDQAADLTVGNTGWYSRVTANHSHSQDYRDGSGRTVPSRWDKWAADVTLGLTPDSDTRYELSAGVGNGEARYASRGMDGTRFKRESVGLRLEKHHIGTTLSAMELQVYYNDADHVMDNFTLRTPPKHHGVAMGHASNVNRSTWGGRFATTWAPANDISLTTGIDTQRSRHRGRRGTPQNSYAQQPWQRNATFTDTGLFGEMTWHPTQAQRLIGGARVDRAEVTDWRGTKSPSPTKTNPTAGQHRRDTLPAGFLRYEYDADSIPATWYVGVGHVERFPDYWELFPPGRGPGGSINAFQGVKPEKTTQLDFGAQYRTKTTNAWFSAYVGRVQDYILFRYPKVGMMGPTQATNVGARILGGELGLSHATSRTWTTSATLAYAWAQNADTDKPLPQIPPLEGRMMANYDDGTWTAGFLWRLVAPQHRYAVNQGNAAGRDWGKSPGFGVLSMNAGYAFSRNAQLTLGIDNVFNKTYREPLNRAGSPAFGYTGDIGFNEPGRTVWARLGVMY
ncbi:TonB-dependent copper receptor [Bordetella sp. 15P40C-2]|uniref:TonB-dependent copper receptor n=1 Tax=Bordetella sp. 15P40C-2 TaxID=2572246 RepID=UPI001EFFF504|nr:TonB-dependent copper receptor [Bordetella sp. 15P40C-2]